MGVRLVFNDAGVGLKSWMREVGLPVSQSRIVAPLLIFLGTRLGLLVLGYACLILAPHNPFLNGTQIPTGSALLNPWIRWDSISYLSVANTGYAFDPVTHYATPALAPLYPFVIQVLSVIGARPGVVAILVSNLSFAASLVVICRLASLRSTSLVAIRAVFLLAIAPYSFLYAAAYPLSLALFFAALAFLATEARRPWLAGGAAALAALTYPLGLAVWTALAIRHISRFRHEAAGRWALLLSLMITPAALALFALYLTNQVGFDQLYAASLILGVQYSPATLLEFLQTAPAQLRLILGISAVLAVLSLAVIPRVWRRYGPAIAVYCLTVLGLAIVADPGNLGFAAMMAFPCFVAFAEILHEELVDLLATLSSCLILAVLTASFVGWFPINLSANPQQVALAQSADQQILLTFHRGLIRDTHPATMPPDLMLKLDNDLLFLAATPVGHQYAPGQVIPEEFYLYVMHPPAQGYLMSARLSDATGRILVKSDRTLWGKADQLLFQSGEPSLIQDNYVKENVPLELGTKVHPGFYTLDVEIFAIPSFQRLPLIQKDGSTVAFLRHAEIVVANQQDFGAAATTSIPHAMSAKVGDSISLLGYGLQEHDRTAQVSLYWKALQRPAYNYTVFVQALDESGKVIAQSDSYPAQGGFPTSQLQAGDVVRDVHSLKLPAGQSGNLRYIVGMYRLETMQRLVITTSASASPADHILLATSQ